MWTIEKVLRWTEARFLERRLASPRLDAQLLLAHVLGRDRVHLYTHFDQPLGPDELGRLRALIQGRLAGTPVAYLVGAKEFRALRLEVDGRVLVPRPDTETLVEVALSLAPPGGRVADIGTGSGAVALALLHERPDLTVVAVDLSQDAVEVARANATRLGLDVEVRQGDLLAPLTGDAPYSLIVSNPPYIAHGALATLAPEVRAEPALALDGGDDGLDLLRRLVAASPPLLAAGGALALEVGAGQAASVAALFERDGRYAPPRLTKDLGGIERVVAARLAGSP